MSQNEEHQTQKQDEVQSKPIPFIQYTNEFKVPNQFQYWHSNIIPVQIHPLPIQTPFPVQLNFNHPFNSLMVQNEIRPNDKNKVPLYCGTCQAYGCKCFYNTAENYHAPIINDQNVSIQILPAQQIQQEMKKNYKISKNIETIQQQHEYYKNAATTAYLNYLQVTQGTPIQNKLNEINLNLMADNFNRNLSLNSSDKLKSSSFNTPRTNNFKHKNKLMSNSLAKMTTTFYQSSPPPLHSSIELLHNNEINPYLHPNNKPNYLNIRQNNTNNFRHNKKFSDYQTNLVSISPLPNTSNQPRRQTMSQRNGKKNQILCKFGQNCRFFKENKCKFYHPSPYDRKKNSIDITDYSIDDDSEIDFTKENNKASISCS